MGLASLRVWISMFAYYQLPRHWTALSRKYIASLYWHFILINFTTFLRIVIHTAKLLIPDVDVLTFGRFPRTCTEGLPRWDLSAMTTDLCPC